MKWFTNAEGSPTYFFFNFSLILCICMLSRAGLGGGGVVGVLGVLSSMRVSFMIWVGQILH